ncbi:MAG: branched-chain amino acid ABC transporter substrate-binding protein [Alphaproteobacteria bacterium]|nr:branched-chain amino acid ABC transporter substrate-binding protein [Alphaproteobacteria bacterium]
MQELEHGQSFLIRRPYTFKLGPLVLLIGYSLAFLSQIPSLLALSDSEASSSRAIEEGAVVSIGYLKQEVKRLIPLSRLNVEPGDLGIAGAEIALKDNNTTGKFTKQAFTLDVERVPIGADAIEALRKLVEKGNHFVLVDAPAETLLRLADSVKDKDVLLFNVSAPEVRLRQEDCRANVLHTAPDRAMLADALAQYLVWKQWQRWLVLKGVHPEDLAYLDALHRAVRRFGATIVEEREYKETPGARRSDTGQQQIQLQMPVFTQGAPTHDVVVVADEAEIFGPYLPYRTWDPRPVAGTAGLKAMSWHPAHEQWGATQMQNRFQRFANRFMLPLDYQAWIAVRAIGEAASRTQSSEFASIAKHLRSDKLELAAFKGQKVTFRPWDGQLRQPLLVAGPELPVSMSPQQGFLHEYAEVDTLGIDQPESKCELAREGK